MIAGFAVRKLGYLRMMSAGLLSLVASLLLDSRPFRVMGGFKN